VTVDEIPGVLSRFDTKERAAREAAWSELRSVGERALPLIEEFWPKARRLEARRAMTYFAIPFALSHEAAFRISAAFTYVGVLRA
jgi:hypothetical protein